MKDVMEIVLVIVIPILALFTPIGFAMYLDCKTNITKAYIEKGYARVPVQYTYGKQKDPYTSWTMCWVPATNLNINVKVEKGE
jgi:hypothetical protein